LNFELCNAKNTKLFLIGRAFIHFLLNLALLKGFFLTKRHYNHKTTMIVYFLQKYFFSFSPQTDSKSYVVIFKVHCHNTITKDVVINIVGNLVFILSFVHPFIHLRAFIFDVHLITTNFFDIVGNLVILNSFSGINNVYLSTIYFRNSVSILIKLLTCIFISNF
jgi:hypothetical protein